MSTVSSTIELYDSFSDVIDRIANAVNYSVSAMEQMRGSLESPFNDAALQGARAATENMNTAIRDIENSVQAARNNIDNFSNTVESVETAAQKAQQATEQFKGSTSNTVSAVDQLRNTIVQQQTTMNQLENDYMSLVISQQGTSNEAVELAGQIQNLNNELNENIETLQSAQRAAAELTQRTETTESAVNQLRNTISQQEQTLNQLKEQYTSLMLSQEGTSDESESLAIRIQNLSNELNENIESLEAAQTATDNLTRSTEEMGEQGANAAVDMMEAADSVSQLMVAAGGYKVLGFIKDAFVDASSAAIEFQSAATGIYKTVDGTREQLEGLTADVKTMALSIPSTTTEIAGVMENAGQLGIKTTAVTDFTETMINLGESTNLTADAAASMLAKFANVTSMNPDNYSNLGSVIVDLGNNFATTEADIVSMSSYLASAATLAGFAETDILGLSTAMSSVGIEAEAGGSAMSKLITKMQIAVETGDGLQQFASTANMTMSEFSNRFGNDAVGALQAFITGLNDVEKNGASASVILQQMDLDDIRLSNTIRALASSGSLMNNAVNTANQAWTENTALANEANKRYDTLESKLQITKNAANNLKIAVGDTLNPSLEKLTGVATSVLTDLSAFAEENPRVTAGFMGAAGAVGVAIGGFTTIVPVIATVTKAMKTLDITLSASKIGLILGGIAAAGALVGYALSSTADKVEDYTGTLEQCSKEIEQTKAELEAVSNTYGENEEAVQSLNNKLDLLNKQYEQAGGAVEDYAQRAQRAADNFKKIKDAYDEQISAIDNTENSAIIAAAQLETLSSKAVITNSDLEIMSRHADFLNNDFKCNIKVNYDTKELTNFKPDQVMDIIKQKAEANRANVAAENYFSSDNQNKYMQNYQDMMNAYKEYKKAEEYLNSGGYEVPGTFVDKLWNGTIWDEAFGANYQDAVSEYQKQKANYDNLKATYDNFRNEMEMWGNTAGFSDYNEQYLNYLNYLGETPNADLPPMIQAQNIIDSALTGNVENAMAEAVGAALGIAANGGEEIKDTMSNALSPEEVAGNAYLKYEEEINDLAETYAKACESIKNTLNNMFGLFEEAKMNLEETLSLDSATESLQSQLDYFNQYKEAIEQLKGLEVDANIITQLSPEQAVAFANELNGMDVSGAQSKIKELNDTFNELTTVKDDISNNLGGLEIELPEKMAKIKEDVEKEITEMSNSMNFTDDAVKAANETMSGYLSEITSVGALAVSEAQSIASQIKEALNINANFNYSANGNSDEISRGYATGTLSAAPGLALVGENGPELVNFGGGEVVYTADETRRIFDSYSNPFSSINMNSFELPESMEIPFALYQENEPEINLDVPEGVEVPVSVYQENRFDLDIPQSAEIPVYTYQANEPEFDIPYSMEIPLNVYQANEAEYNLRQRQNDNSASNLVNEYQSEKVNVYIPRGIDELIEINKQLTTAITTRNTTDNTIVNVSIPKIDLDISRQFERFSGAKATDYYTEDLPKDDNDKRSISDDDFKYLKDLAEREVINRVYSPEIKIEMVNHNNVNSDMDIDDMVDKMVRGFEEAVEVSTEGVHV